MGRAFLFFISDFRLAETWNRFGCQVIGPPEGQEKVAAEVSCRIRQLASHISGRHAGVQQQRLQSVHQSMCGNRVFEQTVEIIRPGGESNAFFRSQ